jgi:phage tail sheath protein FI
VSLRLSRGRATSHAALYYPWITIRDPVTGAEVSVPPGGHVAGVYARTDRTRGVHKAPANEVVRGARDLEFQVTQPMQDVLNPLGVNTLRDFSGEGRGILVWGARTLSSDPEWRYVSVRRLFLFLEESIDKGTQWVVFEPNDQPLWAKVLQIVGDFLTTLWRNGALQGTTPDEAFFVRCDHTTMTQDDIDNGRLICLIGFAPVKPAEFTIFRIQQRTVEAQ